MEDYITQAIREDQQRDAIKLLIAGFALVCLFFGVLGMVIRAAVKSGRK